MGWAPKVAMPWHICLQVRASAAYLPFVKKETIDEAKLAREVNALNAELLGVTANAVQKAIRVGEILCELEVLVGHGNWRTWLADNLSFSYRTAARYLRFYLHRDKLTEAKTVEEAEEILSRPREKGHDAIGADYVRIEKELVGAVKAVRAKLNNLTYVGDSAESVERILEKLRDQCEGLLDDLGWRGF